MSSTNTIRLSNTDRGIRAAVALLAQGQTVAFPTETVYGLGADARMARAVAGIYEAKGRPRFNPLIVHVPDLAALEALVELPAQAAGLAAAFLPGPLTLVLPRKTDTGVSDLVTAGLPTLAVRIPAHPLAQELLRAYGGPIAAPSANPSGRISATHADHVMEAMTGRIGAVLDGGACPVGLESTIVGFSDAQPVLLRAGGIPREAISEATGRQVLSPDNTKITAPGQLASHYAPELPIRLRAEAPDAGELWLGFGAEGYRGGHNLSRAGDLTEAAANLFAYLHQLDALGRETGATGIAVADVPEHGLGLAINDRLQRAAAPRP